MKKILLILTKNTTMKRLLLILLCLPIISCVINNSNDTNRVLIDELINKYKGSLYLQEKLKNDPEYLIN